MTDTIAPRPDVAPESAPTTLVHRFRTRVEEQPGEDSDFRFHPYAREERPGERICWITWTGGGLKRIVHENRETKMLPDHVIPEMFQNIKSIYLLHNETLLPQFEERLKNWCVRGCG